MHRILLLLAGLALVPSAAAAQPATPPRPADASEVTDAEMELGLRIVELSGLAEATATAVSEMMDLQMETQPELAPYRGVLEQWAVEVFRGPEAAEGFARVYAERFTAGELRDLVTFYESPVGRRLTAEQGSIMEGGGEVGERLAEAHQGELMVRLEKAMAVQERKQE